MMTKQSYVGGDLFCGAGLLTTAMIEVFGELGIEPRLFALNHWQIAIDSHHANHPEVTQICDDIRAIRPRDVVPGGRLKILVAAPECIFHSRARGGRPVDDQRRETARKVLDWMDELYIENVLIENVPEFQYWGPLGADGKPLKSKRGQLFRMYIEDIKALEYNVEWRVLTCANYGDPTTRERLFIMARRKPRKIVWPESTHSKTGGATLFGPVKKWVPAKDIIDWTDQGTSIFNRKRPLKPNTMRRIAVGMAKFNGLSFVLPNEGFYRGNAPRSKDEPVPTVTRRGAGNVVNPQSFLTMYYGTSNARSIEEPVPTVTGNGQHIALTSPFMLGQQSGAAPRKTDQPVPTVAGAGAIALVNPWILNNRGGNDGYLRSASSDDPMPTVTGHPPLTIVNPFIIETLHGGNDGRSYPVDGPMKTITSVDGWAIANPYIVEYHGPTSPTAERVRSIDRPMPTVAASGEQHALATPVVKVSPDLYIMPASDAPDFGPFNPFVIKYYGSGPGACSINEPVPTLTTRDRFALIVPIGNGFVLMDILMRMFSVSELAAAQSCKTSYYLVGTREQKVKQIGNGVPRMTGKALIRALLTS